MRRAFQEDQRRRDRGVCQIKRPELRRGRGRYAKYRPYAFTEQGVANAELTRKLNVLEAMYDKQFKVVFDVNSQCRRHCRSDGSDLRRGRTKASRSAAPLTGPRRTVRQIPFLALLIALGYFIYHFQ